MTVTIIGIISDTHGNLPRKAVDILMGNYEESQVVQVLKLEEQPGQSLQKKRVDRIIHAGDIGELEPLSQGILDSLEKVAPVHAVLGNRDIAGYVASGEEVSERLLCVDVCGLSIAVMHELKDLHAALVSSGLKPRVRVHGHTHVPKLERLRDGLVICPGALHKPRGDWPRRTVALLFLEEPGKILRAEIVGL